jgi:hypothetical protein
VKLPLLVALLALTAPTAAVEPAAALEPSAALGFDSAVAPSHVRVTTRMVVVDRSAVTRAGLGYVVLGNDRVRVSARDDGRRRRGGVALGTLGIRAFLEAARDSRWVTSESTQQVLALSGAEARVASTELAIGRSGARTRGPTLTVVPVVQADGMVLLRVSARLEDTVSSPWGYTVDGSPAAVETEVLARPGEEVLLASSSSVERTRDAGLLVWGSGEHERDVLVVVTAEIVD